jgi:hypothetical protein
MKLGLPEPPQTGRNLVVNALNKLLSNIDAAPAAILEATDRLLISEPHRSFGVSTVRLGEAGNLAEAAFHTGWRYLVADAQLERAVASVEVVSPGDSEPYVVGINQGPLVDATVDAIEVAEQAEGADEAYEVRFIEIPALHFAGLWLVGDRDHRMIPLVQYTARIARGIILSEDAVTTTLVNDIVGRSTQSGHFIAADIKDYSIGSEPDQFSDAEIRYRDDSVIGLDEPEGD